jgi:hypothetical protein
LSKLPKYFYDSEAVKEKSADPESISGMSPRNLYGLGKTDPSGFGQTRVGFANSERKQYPGRNLRSVWAINPKGYKGAHFATFPEDLIIPMIKAGSSERGVCTLCHAPFIRVVSQSTTFEGGSGRAGRSAQDVNDNGKWAGIQYGTNIKLGPVVSSNTLGWRPSCDCHDVSPWIYGNRKVKYDDIPAAQLILSEYDDLPTIPAIVGDMFGGSGTVSIVAEKLGRDSIIMELNDEYCAMNRDRIDKLPVATQEGFT